MPRGGDATRIDATLLPPARSGRVLERTGDRGALVDLPSDLRDLLAEALHTRTELRRAEAAYTHRVSLVARAATGRRMPIGGSAMSACASVLGMARRSLQGFSMIGGRWRLDGLRELFQLNGGPEPLLTASHLALIAPLSAPERQRWIDSVLHEGLSVRALRDKLRAASARDH